MGYKYKIPKRKNPDKVYTQEELYREYHPIILKMLSVKNRDRMDAEDIAHNIFLKLFKMWDKIRWESLEQLLSVTVYHRVVDYYKQVDTYDQITSGIEFIELVDLGLANDPFKQMNQRDFKRILNESFDLLTVSERPVFIGFYINNKSARELKEDLGKKSISTILNLLSKSRNKISVYFDKHYVHGVKD